ncbi:hypothetical protein N0V95_003597 [Ascochyta clinopodiicola]|nr:hypothetical protein N0V95_003597 [Ascochyta clinopodiicola]
MAEELEKLRQQLREAEARASAEKLQRKEEQRRREEAEAQVAEEQRRREKAEAVTVSSNLAEFLQGCHEMSRSINIVTDRSLTTQGDVTKPAGRLYPRRIIPWGDFSCDQEAMWTELSSSPAFEANRVFPSAIQLDYVRTHMDPVDSEDKLRHFAREAVEKQVQTLVGEIFKDANLRTRLRLQGRVSFESHANLGQSDGTTATQEAMQQMSISDASKQAHDDNGESRRLGKRRAAPARSTSSRPRTGKGGGRADQFCIYRHSDGQSVPAVAIEYKAPHKLTRADIALGLSGEIVLDRDIIDKEYNSPESYAKWLLAAVVTQCFSYMVYRGIQYGYIFTGDAIVFLHIPDDPTTIYYYVSVPTVDVQDDDESRLHRTAVAQVSTFVLRALVAEPPPQAWHQATSTLNTWAVEYMDILKQIPETDRKAMRETSLYQPSRWAPFLRSRIQTRSQCLPTDDRADERRDSDSDSGDSNGRDNGVPSTPTPQRTTRSQSRRNSSRQEKGRAAATDMSTKQAKMIAVRARAEPRLNSCPYCTHDCLLGLMRGDALDQLCPNFSLHGRRHIEPKTFLRRVQQQLAVDLGTDADCRPLYLQGSRGALFKVRLSSHGYTFVAKAVEQRNLHHLQHEHDMYQHVLSAQGRIVPVCLGLADLKVSYFYDGGVYTHMLFLSWAGRPLSIHINQENKLALLQEARQMLEGLHRLCLLHRDPAVRNILWDNRTGRLMWTDLERAEACQLPLHSPGTKGKRKRPSRKKSCTENAFSTELSQLSMHVAHSVY